MPSTLYSSSSSSSWVLTVAFGGAGLSRFLWKVEWIFILTGRSSFVVTGPFVSLTLKGLTLRWSSFLLGLFVLRFFCDRNTLSLFLRVSSLILCLFAFCNAVIALWVILSCRILWSSFIF